MGEARATKSSRRGTNNVAGIKGARFLTPAQRDERTQTILTLVADGLSNEQIAREMDLAVVTVKEWIAYHISPMLGLRDDIHTSCRRAALVALAYHRGYLRVPQ